MAFLRRIDDSFWAPESVRVTDSWPRVIDQYMSPARRERKRKVFLKMCMLSVSGFLENFFANKDDSESEEYSSNNRKRYSNECIIEVSGFCIHTKEARCQREREHEC